MPPQVTPQAARDAMRGDTPTDTEFLQLDKALLQGGRRFAVPQVIRRQHVETVTDAYRKLGWRVALVSDQRDGDYLKFEG